ncbi:MULTISPECIES: anaerobic ribonucleoside-triphosphate reductase activating protein [unclassified Treponema]|uniref:anaerobic ribonucleoside-triphosphate reductase activating protein n=1 Tax=unclassified Treponema TaxID=2638727 RepID=UPI0020A38ECE|nr:MULTISPECIES: anaerobic ribonucleoside-triphosphate reductase activating protein [unclassified Treponema]UTC67633.1 anaerobic ribonucleoside-triphosphate reductase activating protein [Treponema sp. OMZ 789]UTC70361.1 anaerobic ribonucleoside-triphosphate reductase activating protein [Treponema sp. OMZ 790]UTC73075.1 anaerobic ribonucleoside-triphosphate reductase activating protein [Treponema sp. OMZ 791]
MLAGLQKTTLVNFPRRVSAAVFLPGCNMRCPYCHNAELALASPSSFNGNPESQNDYYELSEIYDFLEKRKNLISGLVISGGEPLMSPALFELIERAKYLELAVKIDTNGLFPERLEEILSSQNLKPDMIALDVKTSPERYGELLASKTASAAEKAKASLLKTIDILKSNSGKIETEYRTVLAPPLVSEAEIKKIASLLPKNARWRLAQFVPGVCLTPEWNSVEPYPLSTAQGLTAAAKSLIPDTELR